MEHFGGGGVGLWAFDEAVESGDDFLAGNLGGAGLRTGVQAARLGEVVGVTIGAEDILQAVEGLGQRAGPDGLNLAFAQKGVDEEQLCRGVVGVSL